jgi:hypothetical protein
VPCLQMEAEAMYGNKLTCALVHSWQRFWTRVPCVFTRSSVFLVRTTGRKQCTQFIAPHNIKYIWLLKTYLRHVLVQVYYLQALQWATLNTNCQC